MAELRASLIQSLTPPLAIETVTARDGCELPLETVFKAHHLDEISVHRRQGRDEIIL